MADYGSKHGSKPSWLQAFYPFAHIDWGGLAQYLQASSSKQTLAILAGF